GKLGWFVVGLGVLGFFLVGRVRRGYVETLSSNLAARAVELDELTRVADDDATAREAIRTTLLDVRQQALRRTLGESQLGKSLMKSLQIELTPEQLAALRASKPAERRSRLPEGADPVLEQLEVLA